MGLQNLMYKFNVFADNGASASGFPGPVMMSRGRRFFLLLVVLCGAACGVLGAPSASTINANAIKKADKGDLMGALALFKKAVAAEPRNGEYVNNEGVTLMRLTRYPEARDCFERALAYNPHNALAWDNVKARSCARASGR